VFAAAAALGFFVVADAFSLGNSLPTIVYILVIGGSLDAVFVPQLVRRMPDDADDGKAYADRLLTAAGLAPARPVGARRQLAAPLIVDLYTPSDYPSPPSTSRLPLPGCACRRSSSTAYTRCSPRSSMPAGTSACRCSRAIANDVIAIATFGLFVAIAGHLRSGRRRTGPRARC
jgi:putative peptidoglycan lipid II flippase